MTDLPPSLAVTPNIAFKNQTLDQLVLERDYWQAKIDKATSWGSAIGVSGEFRDECQKEIDRRSK